MKKTSEKLNSLQLNSLQYFMIRWSVVGITTRNLITVAAQDGWISCIIGLLLGLIPFALYHYLHKKYPEDTIVEISQKKFGTHIGKIISLILILFVFFLSMVVYWDLINFISSQYLHKTPTYPLSILFLFPLIYLITGGIKVIGRTSTILFFISIIVLGLSLLGLVNQYNLANLAPVLEKGMLPVFNGAIQFLAYNVVSVFLLLMIPRNDISDKDKYEKQSFLFYLFSTFTVLELIVTTSSVFGLDLAYLYQYPEFHLLKRVSLAGFITRIESTLSIQWMLHLFMMSAICLYFVTEGISRCFDIKKPKINKGIIITACILVAIGNEFIFCNNTVGNKIVLTILPYLLLFFFFVIPLIYYFKKDKKH